MRFNRKMPAHPGDSLWKTIFLWKPRCFGENQWRWLEKATIRSVYKQVVCFNCMPIVTYKNAWVEVEFVELKKD